ncbi:hypothetical protein [Halarchaeum nitratireducens]|uniref:Uncharacterized protein n=1 Tax=Halarchaeum nitratireducens TaxID=489913 RepID=A0A830GCR4_9EURY|nr:hypothetical protein [Halarchaeum nitratireducens]GGN20502.1 hypothetical protein GCM10009021_22020 [Halarchaeum nitratireducens]
MSVGDSLQRIGCFLEKCEQRSSIDVRGADVTITDDEARVDADIALATDDGTPTAAVDVRDASLDADGSLAVTLALSGPLVPSHADAIDVAVRDVSLTPTPTTVVTARTPVRSGSSAGNAPTATTPTPDDAQGGGDADVPPFRDADRLAEIYASCETFAEMADVIEMDVSAETVRRYMIRNGIHEPDSYDTGNADDATTPETAPAAQSPSTTPDAHDDTAPPIRTDGMGLPESVTVDDLVVAVNDAETIREVGRCLGIERMDAFELLTDLDLLEFVMGRLTRDDDGQVGREQILARLRETAVQS